VKLYRITEDDLQTLEESIPFLCDAMMSHADLINRKEVNEHLSMLKTIVSNVRWGYGPPTEVEIQESA